MIDDTETKIIVNKAITNSNHYYFQNNLEAFNEAMNKLHSIGAIKLYFYLSKNKEKYNMILKKDEFCDWANESETSFEQGFKELIDTKYLIEVLDSNGNLYNFYDYDYNRDDLKRKEEYKNKNNSFMFCYNYFDIRN